MRTPILLLAGLLGACSASSTTEPASTLASAGSAAAAARIRCEVSAGRSKISVDGRGLRPATAMYSARVTSGGATVSAPARAAVAGEAEFDFDSNPRNIRAGATPIAADFISGASVTAEVLDGTGATVASGSAACRVR